MINFDPNIDNIVESCLSVKASGAIIDQIANDLLLPDGQSISLLLENEKKETTN